MQTLLISVFKGSYIEIGTNGLEGSRAHGGRIAQLREHGRGKAQLFADVLDYRFWDALRFRKQDPLDTSPQQHQCSIESLRVSTHRAEKIQVIWCEQKEAAHFVVVALPGSCFPFVRHPFTSAFLCAVDSAANPV